jgi:hypothetical protein
MNISRRGFAMQKWQSVYFLVLIMSFQFSHDTNSSNKFLVVKSQADVILRQVRIKEMKTFGEDQIYGAYGIAGISDGSFIISDKLDNKIKQFDVSGKLIREIGKKGRGPAKFSGPSALAAGKNTIAVADFQSPRVQLFSFDFKYIDEFYAPGPVINLAFDRNDELWIGMLSFEGSNSLVKVNDQGDVTQGICLKNVAKDPFDNLFNFTILKDGTIFVVYACQNVIEKWDIHGTFYFQRHVPGFPKNPARIPFPTSHESNNNRNQLVPSGSLFFKITSDTLNNIYIVGEDYSINPLRDVFVLNQDGDLTALLELPRETEWIYIDSRQYLWSIEGQRMRICKYKILNN